MNNDGKLEGIISERDILRESAERDKMLRTTKVFQGMTENVIVGVPEDDIEYTIGVMTKNRIRHLPILENEKIAGIISLGDIVNAQLDEREYDNRYLKQYMFWELKLHFIRDRHTILILCKEYLTIIEYFHIMGFILRKFYALEIASIHLFQTDKSKGAKNQGVGRNPVEGFFI
ncbi:CBS domain-containing protein [candidate division KSB1 bacterium]|nr:CBS domain-containing protein [candidate division KSB1 bacterium]